MRTRLTSWSGLLTQPCRPLLLRQKSSSTNQILPAAWQVNHNIHREPHPRTGLVVDIANLFNITNLPPHPYPRRRPLLLLRADTFPLDLFLRGVNSPFILTLVNRPQTLPPTFVILGSTTRHEPRAVVVTNRVVPNTNEIHLIVMSAAEQ